MISIILAGGFATRLWPLTGNKAKPLLHLKDGPMISHIVEGLPHDMEIIISTNAAFEDNFSEWAKGFGDHKISIFVEDSKSDAGKKGALAATAMVIEERGIEEDLLLIAGDNYFGFELQRFIDAFRGNPILAAYDIQDLSQARKFGVVVAKDGHVVEFQEKPEQPKSTLVSTGCYLFPQKNLNDIVEYSRKHNDNLGGVFEHLLEKGETIDVFSFDEVWYDIGSFDAYLKANRELIDNDVIMEEGVQLDVSNKLRGSVFVGKNTRMTNCVVDNAVILGDCNLDNCVIRNCVVDEGCHLKGIDLTHQMVRRGSRIER